MNINAVWLSLVLEVSMLKSFNIFNLPAVHSDPFDEDISHLFEKFSNQILSKPTRHVDRPDSAHLAA